MLGIIIMKAHIKRNNIKFESKLYLFSIKNYGRLSNC